MRGKRPTLAQKKIIAANVGTPGDWLVQRAEPDRLHLVHRYMGTTKIIFL
ncbi:DUF6906 family protein [Paenibacillus bouchesdurhonensis]